MLSFKADKLAWGRFAVVFAAILVINNLTIVPDAQMQPLSFDKPRQLELAAQQERRTITEYNESGESGSQIKIKYSDGNHSMEIRTKGGLAFTDTDADIKSIAQDGYLMIEERRGSLSRKLEVVPGTDGQPQRSYYVRGKAHAFDQEGRAWLAEILPEVIRNSGIGAHARVERIFRQRGAAGVLDEISLIKSDGAKRIYFRELLGRSDLETPILRRAAHQAAREISSDGEKAYLPIESADLYLDNEAVTPDFFSSIRSIHSDGEHSRVLSALLKKKLGNENTLRTLKSARAISSDGEKADLLIQHADLFLTHSSLVPILFDTINSISSDGEHARVLTSLLKRQTLSRENLARLIRSAEQISSDGEKANVLLAAIKVYSGDGAALSAIAEAIKTISSDGEKQRVLSAMERHGH
jgi:hypothetical protein